MTFISQSSITNNMRSAKTAFFIGTIIILFGMYNFSLMTCGFDWVMHISDALDTFSLFTHPWGFEAMTSLSALLFTRVELIETK